MSNSDVPLDRQILRCWVELRDVRDGATRNLPLSCIQKINLKPRTGLDIAAPHRVEIHVQDGPHTWIAADIRDLSAQLRTQYPDDAFERTLRCERDEEAENRRQAAIQKLGEIVSRAALHGYLKEGS